MSNFRTYNKENFDESYNYPNRTPYDQLMDLVYNPNSEKMHPAPWPMERSNFDLTLQKKWCLTDCGFENEENVPTTMAPQHPTMIPIGPTTMAPQRPTMMPIEPTMAPSYPTMAPQRPTMIPIEPPTISPIEPTMAPSYPTMAPSYPTMAPSYPTMAPSYPTMAPIYH